MPKKKSIRSLIALALFALATAPAGAAPPSWDQEPGAWCGTTPTVLVESLAWHDYARDALAGERGAAGRFTAASTPGIRAEGHVAVIEDDGTVVSEKSLLDFGDGFAMQFAWKKKKRGYKVSGSGVRVNGDIGEKLPLEDDDSERVALPFKVNFYGTKYSALYVNSDGNVTFEEGDNASTSRDLGRFLQGPPRVAIFFNDLNPEFGDGVYLKTTGNAVRITWREVPEFGSSNKNTFQLTIFKKGKILFAYESLDGDTGVVGISPGRGALLDLLDFTEDLPTNFKTFAIAESFADQVRIDEVQVAKTLLSKFKDQYHTIVFFADFPILLDGAIAYEITVKNDIRGIGDNVYDVANLFGSSGALQSIVNMGYLTQYPNNVKKPGFFGGYYAAQDILLHEIGHRWLAFVRVKIGGNTSTDLLGRGGAHWGFHHNVDGSFMEGSTLQDNGDGTFLSLLPSPAQYSQLDRYLMGLLAPEGVGPMFYVSPVNSTKAPEAGVTIAGQRVDFTLDNILSVEKDRRPAFGQAPTTFKVAFVVIGRSGEPVTAAAIKKVNTFRKAAEKLFRIATGGVGRLETKLVEK